MVVYGAHATSYKQYTLFPYDDDDDDGFRI